MLSAACCRSCDPKIAGAMPTWSLFQVLESEVQTSKNAEGCPYPVDRRCPHAGTSRSSRRSRHPASDEDASSDTMKVMFKIFGEPSAHNGGLDIQVWF